MRASTLFVLGTTIFSLAGTASSSSAQPATAQTGFQIDEELAEKGEDLFKSKQCFGCHRIGEQYIGPDLEGLLDRRTVEWVRKMIRNPERMTAEDSIARELKKEFNGIQMPTPSVTDQQIEALLHYIASESEE